jgi:hypothetical protein
MRMPRLHGSHRTADTSTAWMILGFAERLKPKSQPHPGELDGVCGVKYGRALRTRPADCPIPTEGPNTRSLQPTFPARSGLRLCGLANVLDTRRSGVSPDTDRLTQRLSSTCSASWGTGTTGFSRGSSTKTSAARSGSRWFALMNPITRRSSTRLIMAEASSLISSW